MVFNTLVLVTLKLILMGLVKLTSPDKEIGRWLRKANTLTSWNLWLMLVDSVMFDVLLASIINIQNIRFTTVFTTVSGVVSLLGIVMYTVQMLFVYHYSRTMFGKKLSLDDSQEEVAPTEPGQALTTEDKPLGSSSADTQSKLETFYRQLKVSYYFEDSAHSRWTSQYKILLLQSKTVVSILIVVFTFDYPLIQVVGIAAIQLISAVVFCVRPAHKSRKENFKHIFTECALGMIMLGAAVLIDSFNLIASPKDRYLYMGYTLIGVTGTLFAVIVLITIYESVATIVETFKKICKKNKKNSVENQTSLRTMTSAVERVQLPTVTQDNTPMHSKIEHVSERGWLAQSANSSFEKGKAEPDWPESVTKKGCELDRKILNPARGHGSHA